MLKACVQPSVPPESAIKSIEISSDCMSNNEDSDIVSKHFLKVHSGRKVNESLTQSDGKLLWSSATAMEAGSQLSSQFRMMSKSKKKEIGRKEEVQTHFKFPFQFLWKWDHDDRQQYFLIADNEKGRCSFQRERDIWVFKGAVAVRNVLFNFLVWCAISINTYQSIASRNSPLLRFDKVLMDIPKWV